MNQLETLKEVFFITDCRAMRVVYFVVSFNFHTSDKTQKRQSPPPKSAICMQPLILLNTYQMGVKLLPGRVW